LGSSHNPWNGERSYVIERSLGVKKVRYLMGAVGLAPAALGLLTQAPSAAAATHTANPAAAGFKIKPGKTVYLNTDSGCAGSTERQHTVFSSQKKNWIELGFWSKHNAADSRTCIGTIFVHAGGDINWVAGNLLGKDGSYYCKDAGTPSIEYGCHQSFYNPFSVFGYGSTNGGAGGGFHMTVGSRVG
jgi:hypothetical protein